jgi:hypothetical protein
MSTMRCNEFFNQLDRWMEGERPGSAAAHVRECVECRGLIAELELIAQTAGSIEDVDPPPRIWISLHAEMVREGIIHSHDERRGWLADLIGWIDGVFAAVPRPALAGAYLVALIAVGVALTNPLGRPVDDPWMTGMQSSTQPLSANLDTAEQATMSSMLDSNPVVTASLQKNLAIVDNYIALCEKNVHEDPESEMARDFLYEAYQQKADLLAQMTERGNNGR